MPSSILRLFVAIYPPVEAARKMLGLAASLGIEDAHRLVPVEQIHMTLQFIGDTQVRELEDVCESVRRSAAGVSSFELRPRRLVTLPEEGLVRLIAVETDAPGPLLEIQRRLVQRLARKPRADGRFVPHLTLQRFAGDAKPEMVDVPVECPPFKVRCVVLVKSILRPTGAVHVRVDEVELERE